MTFDEWWKNETDDNENNVDDWKGFCKTAFEAGQKEIKQLGERCNQLLKDKGNLTDKIEKMKCCNNCKFDNLEPPEIISNGVCENCIHHSKWELED